MRVGSLFSGIGGIDLGLQRAGMEIVWQCEIDSFCQQVLAKHWPDVKRFTDIKEMKEDIPYVDLICGGFPCQPVSCAGKRQGDQDKRWLWPEFRRVVQLVKPEWVLVENVPGLLSADSGRLFGGVLGDLASLGYDAEWQVLSAAQFGAPHLRKRVFIVAYSAGLRFQITQSEDTAVNREACCQRGPQINDAKGDRAPPNAISDQLRQQQGRISRPSRERTARPGADGKEGTVADSKGIRLPGRPVLSEASWQEWRVRIEGDNAWGTESRVGRVANGIPRRVDRLRALGNAVVPQCIEYIGRCILEATL